MQVNGMEAFTGNVGEFQGNVRVNREAKSTATSNNTEPQGDTVEISDEGLQKAYTMKAQTSAGSSATSSTGTANSATDDATSTSASVEDLEQSLQTKEAEVNTKQAKLDAAKREAKGDPTQDGEVKKLQYQVTELENETKKIKAQVYS